MRIHIVDDNVEITKMLSKYFSIKGHECSVSNDGHNAQVILESNKFDVILLDLAMPELSGRDIIKRLSKEGKMNTLKIIVLTASSPSSDYEDELKTMGVRAVLKKPIDPDTLLNYVQQLDKK